MAKSKLEKYNSEDKKKRKFLIIKSLILPLFTFLTNVCLVPGIYQKKKEKKCSKFIRNSKRDQVKKNKFYYRLIWKGRVTNGWYQVTVQWET